jgi:DNA-binding beta-propeller fold protein YncE
MSSRKIFIPLLAAILISLSAGRAFAYKITPLKHLFDIEHGFLQPSDVAIGKDLRIYVLDGVNSQVKVFSENGSFLFSFGSKGNAQGQFESPLGLANDSTGRIFVADTGNRRVQVFSPEGKVQSEFAIKAAKGSQHPCDPVDLALDEQRNRIYVVDNENHKVLLYSLDTFSFIDSWGKEGDGRQDFRYPFFITVGKNRTVFIVDVINTRVQAWDPRGKALSTIGEWGVDTGQLYRPKGVCVDSGNRVFVSDSYVGAIQVFNRYGSFLSVLGDESGKIIKWKTPVGMAIDYRQRLYVVDMIANRVSVYQILEKDIEVAK